MIHEGKLNGVLNRSSCQPGFRLPPSSFRSSYSSFFNLEAYSGIDYRNTVPSCPLSVCLFYRRFVLLSHPLTFAVAFRPFTMNLGVHLGAISYLLWGSQPRIVENSLLAKVGESRVKNFDDNFSLLVLFFFSFFFSSRFQRGRVQCINLVVEFEWNFNHDE